MSSSEIFLDSSLYLDYKHSQLLCFYDQFMIVYEIDDSELNESKDERLSFFISSKRQLKAINSKNMRAFFIIKKYNFYDCLLNR